MKALKYFQQEKINDQIIILRLDAKETEDFINYLPEKFLDCYIDSKTISDAIAQSSGVMSRQDIIKSFLPNKPVIKSGDFSEIISYLYLIDTFVTENIFGPKKWRWKEDPNEAMHKTDVVLFSTGDSPSPDDFVVSAESKGNATGSMPLQVNAAINGVKQDSTTRLAVTLDWMRKKAQQKGDNELFKATNRFINSAETGAYTKHFRAIIVTDFNFDDKDLESLSLDGIEIENVEIVLICIAEMKEMYEQVFARIPTL